MNTQDKIIALLTEEFTKSDLEKYIKKDKDFEKRVRELISDAVIDIIRNLYQNNAIFKSIIK